MYLEGCNSLKTDWKKKKGTTGREKQVWFSEKEKLPEKKKKKKRILNIFEKKKHPQTKKKFTSFYGLDNLF